MRKGVFPRVAAVFAAAVAGVCFFAVYEREPAYNGRSLSEWLRICRSTGISQEQREEAVLAVRHIGTNGLPILLKRATEPVPPTRGRVRDYLDQHSAPFVPRFVRDWARKPPDSTRVNEAKMGIMLLGPAAAPAIPFLVTLATNASAQNNSYWAVAALGDIGPPALPALITVLTNPVARTRAHAAAQIPRLGTNAAPALPVLIQGIDDLDYRVAQVCAAGIGSLHINPDASIPALLKCLHKIDPDLRSMAIIGIIKFGKDARQALPQLQEAAATESNYQAKELLKWAIRTLEQMP